MVHSVELVFDVDAEARIRKVWDDLSAVGVRSQAATKSASNRPHVTLVVAERMAEGVDEALRPVTA